MTQTIKIIEVGMRDGLQRETKVIIPTEQKVNMIHQLVKAGLKQIQVCSFVHPKQVPQMADAEALCQQLTPYEGVAYSGLVLNLKGLERAQAAGLKHIDMSVSASDSHSRKNANRSLAESLVDFEIMVKKAREMGLQIRAGIQCAFGYYEADVNDDLVLEIAKQHLALGVDSLAIADSTGMADPSHIQGMLSKLDKITGDIPIILHLHDTRGMGLANLLAGIQAGCRQFDTAFGGMGGCNFIPEALGNIPTEDTCNMLAAMGYETGIDIQEVAQVSKSLEQMIGQKLPGKMYSLVN